MKMRSLKILTSKDDRLINSIIKEKKTSSFVLLYHSEWDTYSNKAVDLAKEWASRDGNESCYVISSWELPHVFAAFGISNAPAIVEANRGNIKVYVEYPRIHDYFSKNS